MQSFDWNDLKHFLALFRARKLGKAAQALGTSDTTVSRRIRALEAGIGATLFLRNGRGRYEPTDAALQLLAHAEGMEAAAERIAERTQRSGRGVSGTVRVSSVPIIVNRILLPAIAALTDAHPHLTISLVPAASNLDLSKREADLALRLARPAEGGLWTRAQKFGEIAFSVYAPASDQRGPLQWITYDETLAALPQARWLETIATGEANQQAPLKVADAETALEAVAAGLGKTLLPRVVAERDPRLQAVPVDSHPKLPVREVWLLAHADQDARASISATKNWLRSLDWA